jgi:hypothetical protein
MALSLSFDAEIDELGTSVYLYDITGRYDGSSNTTGWDVLANGGPNDHLSDVTAASVTVYDVDGNSLSTINLLSSYTTLAASEPTSKMKVASLSWGNADGYYKFIFTITTASDIIEEIEEIFLKNTEIAVDTLWLRVFNNGSCNCNSKDAREAIRAEVIFKGMEANKSDITAANLKKIVSLAEDVQDIANTRQLIP